jgi:uncharacterized membrane protein (UPF0182 family)
VPKEEPASSSTGPARIRACSRDTVGSRRRTSQAEERPIVSAPASATRRRSGSTSSSTPTLDHTREHPPIGAHDPGRGVPDCRGTGYREDSWTPRNPATATAHPPALWRTPRTRALLAVGALGLLSAIATATATIVTDALWFGEVGQPGLYWKALAWRLLPLAFCGLGTACFALAVLRRARRFTGPARRGTHTLAAAAAGAMAVALQPPDAWERLALWAHRTDFGVSDPIFHRDAGFFVFTLPLHELLARWLLQTLLMTTALTAAEHALAHGLRDGRRQLCRLAALTLLVLAWRLKLSGFALVLPHAGSPVPGASHTDVEIRLPLLRASVALALSGAALAAYVAFRAVPLERLLVGGLAVTAAAGAAAGLPGLVEAVDVRPQALGRERPYVAAAIAATRHAYGLDRMVVRSQPTAGPMTAPDARAIANVPLWDASVLRPALDETQTAGGYYSFGSPTVDRYGDRLLALAARRLDLGRLAPAARTWANLHFAYTHGYGAAAVAGGETDAEGYPRLHALTLAQPRGYFGERAPDDPPYVVLNTHRGEVEQPTPGSQPPRYHYDGDAGVALDHTLVRAAFALRLRDLDLLLTETITPASRIAIRRDARERVTALAPFMDWDARPQTVVAQGRIRLVFHGYTTSDHYPYAARFGHANYLRAAAVAVVDAFTGRTTLYTADPDDPILRAWRAVFPGLFTDAAALPAAVRRHLRYPARLFAAQARVLETYHADDVTSFWNGADAWRRAHGLAGPVEDIGELRFPHADDDTIVPPAYTLARLPGDPDERLHLTTAFTPLGREGMVGYLAGSADGVSTRLTLLSLPREQPAPGPSQATRQILADPGVERTLQLLNRESRDLGRAAVNRTVLGAPRTVPLGGTLVHVQPVYVTAAGSGFPRLQLVTVWVNGRVGYGPGLREALAAARRQDAGDP